MAARNDLPRHLRSEAPLPVYALVSSSALLLREALVTLRAQHASGPRGFNDETFALRDLAAALQAAATLPMMAARRFVEVTGVHKLGAKDQAPLLAYLEAPTPMTVLCLSGEKLDGRTKLGAQLSKRGCLFCFDPPRPAELPGWIAARAARAGMRLEADAAALLAELLGDDLGVLLTSLDKVALYAGPDATIGTDEVTAAVAATRVASIFELTDAVGTRAFAEASRLLHNLLSGGENAVMVLAMLVRQLRQLVAVSALPPRTSNAAAAAALGVRPFLVDTLRAQARAFTPAQLWAALRAAADADAALKSSPLDAELILDRLLLQIMGERA